MGGYKLYLPFYFSNKGMVKIVKEGKVILVSNNIAHGMIERGEAKLYKAPKNKMMKPAIKRSSKKGYKTK